MSWPFINSASTLAFIPTCFIPQSPNIYLPPALSLSFSCYDSLSPSLPLAEVTHEDNFIFIHVVTHVKSSLNPLPGNCSFWVLVITHANIDDAVLLQPLLPQLCCNEKVALQHRGQHWMHTIKKGNKCYSILRHQYWVYTISNQFA